MKKNIKTLAALLMAGAAFTACSSSDDNIIEQTQNPTEPKVYTLVIKASKGGDATTRALKPGYDEEESKNTVDAYWTGTEKIEVGQITNNVYTKIGEATADPSPDGETIITATLNPTLLDPDNDLYFYLGGHTFDYTGQVGLLTGTNSISEKYDYATDCLYSGSYTVDDINNQVIPGDYEPLEFRYVWQAIIKFTLKDKANNEVISPSAFTVTDGESTVELTSIPATTYTANGAGVLYVAFPASGHDRTITLTATVGDDTYTYTTSSAKTFWCGEYYEITVKMAHTPKTYNLAAVTGDITLKDGDTATGTLAGDYKVSIANGATVTLSGVTITSIPDDPSHKWAGINCPGDATIVLASGTTNTVKGGDRMYPGIYIAPDKTLTIEGSGTLDARSNGNYPDGAGIGGGYNIACGNIVIKGGNITAAGGRGAAGIGGGFKSSAGDASWGYITISGGNITATGGQISTGTSGTIYGGAGIGSGGGTSYRCGQINITGGTINATGGQNAAGIGGGSDSSCGGITISGGTVDVYGGQNAVAIGTGVRVTSNGAPFCGNINITNGVTRVTATKGTDSSSTIGATSGGTRGKITIGGVEFNASITDSPYTYIPQINE